MDDLLQKAIELSEESADRYIPIPGRIAYVVSHGQSYASNGYAIRTQGVAKALNEHGLETLCFVRLGRPWDLQTDNRTTEPEVVVDGVRYIHTRWPAKKKPKYQKDRLEVAADKLVELFRVYRPEKVLVASNFHVGLPAWVAAKRLGLPFFNDVRGFWELSRDTREPGYAESSESRTEAGRDAFVAQKADVVFTLNQPMKQELIRRGAASNKIGIVPNGVSCLPKTEIADPTLKEHLGIELDDKVIGYVGSFSPYEGLDVLIEACAELVQKGEKLKLLLVGDDQPLIGSSAANIANTGLTDTPPWLIQVGRVPHDQVAGYYALLDAVVIPRKPLAVCQLVPPMKAAEALAYGKWLVVSDVAPLAEYAHKHDGVVTFEAGNAASLATVIQRSLKLPAPKPSTELLFSAHTEPMVRALKGEEGEKGGKSEPSSQPVVGSLLAASTDGIGSAYPEKMYQINQNNRILEVLYLPGEAFGDIETVLHEFMKVRAKTPWINLTIAGEYGAGGPATKSVTTKQASEILEGVLYRGSVDSFSSLELSKYDLVLCPALNKNSDLIKNLEQKEIPFIKEYDEIHHFFKTIDSLCSRKMPSLVYFAYSSPNELQTGYHKRTLYLAEGLRNIGIDVSLLSFRSLRYLVSNGICFIPNDIAHMRMLLRWIEPLIVIAASNHENAEPFFKLREELGFTLVYEIRGLWYETYAAKILTINPNHRIENDAYYINYRKKELDTVKRADKVISISPEIAEHLSELLPDIQLNVHVAGNGVELSKKAIQNRETRQPFVVGCFGTLTYYEGIPLLIEAVQELRASGYDIEILLVGKDLISKHYDFNKYQFVTYEKFKENIDAEYGRVNLFVMPRMPFAVCNLVEPLKPFEYLARGAPLLLSDCDALRRISHDGENCLLFRAGDKDDLGKKIIDVYEKGYPRSLIESALTSMSKERDWQTICQRYAKFLKVDQPERKKIYFLYADKWRISYKWSGASINVINEMALLAGSFDVYYNDVFVNDLFYDGVFDENAFIERYSERARQKPKVSKYLPKVIVPSRDYYACFYRSGNKPEQVEFYQSELTHPKIYSHNYVESIWKKGIVGFQTETASEFAARGELQTLGDDGTLGYQDISVVPRQAFIRYQGIPGAMPKLESIIKKRNAGGLKQKLGSSFLIGISGTIYEHTYPYSLIEVIRGLRKKYPSMNICLVAYVVNMLTPLPKEEWIHITQFEKHEQEEALLELDVFVNTWKHAQQIYGGSNKNLDALSLGIPVISPRTPAIEEQLGVDYPLYFTFDSAEKRLAEKSEEELWSCIEACFSPDYRKHVSEYLLAKRVYRSNHAIRSAYEKQLAALYKKRILLVAQNLNVGGVQKYSMQVLKALSDYQVTLATAEEIPVDRLNQISGLCDSIKVIRLKELARTRAQYDVAFLNSYPVEEDALNEVMSVLKGGGCRIYPIVHTDIHIFTRNIVPYLDVIDGLVTVADRIVDKLEVNTHTKLGHKSHLVTPVLDSNLDSNDYAEPKRKRSYKVGYFGRIVGIKGVEFLVKSFARFTQEENCTYELHIYGPIAKPYLADQLDKVAEVQRERNIFVHNRTVDAKERKVLLKELDALIYTTAMDGLPYTFLEAMELGTPVLSTSVGGISHLINDRYNGMLFDFPDLYVENLFSKDPYKELLHKLQDNQDGYYQNFKNVMKEFSINDRLFYEMSRNAISSANEWFRYSVMLNKLRNIVGELD